jgi:DNA-binding response OmpR family regulator
VYARKTLAALVVLVLRHCAVDSETTSTAARTRELIEQGHVDLVVVELARPRARELIGLASARATLAVVDPDHGGSSFDAFSRGADQVVRVPFTPDELAVRAAVLLRRSGAPAWFSRNEPFDDIELSLDEYARVGGRTVRLGATLNSLLYVAAANSGRVISRSDVRTLTWGVDPAASDASVDRLVRRLGRSIGPQSALTLSTGETGIVVRGR